MKITGIIETMKDLKLSSKDYQFFLFKALFWLGVAWIGFIAALGGFFYAPYLWILIVILGIFLVYYFILKNGYSVIISREMLTISMLSLLAVILFSYFSTPTIFSGRDQGAISEAAIRLVQNHTFEFSTPASTEFFKIYGPGRALNFPGFYYSNEGNLTTQFPLVYIVWLALFYSLFGTIGFIVANAILFFIFILSFYLLARIFLRLPYSLLTLIFTLTSFSFMWFLKFTLSENMALSLLWLSILSLMLFLKNFRRLCFYVFFMSSALLFFTRIEGIAIMTVSAIIILCNNAARKFIKEKIFLRFFLPAIFFAIIFIANIFRDFSFYHEVAKVFLSPFIYSQNRYADALKDIILPAFYIEKVFLIYGLIGFFIVGAIGIFFYIWKKEYYKLIPLFIALPTFIYFFDSHITNDNPWMLRRFMFSLLPIGIFYAGLILGRGLENMKNKKIFIFSGILSILLIANNFPPFLKYLTFSENQGLDKQAATFAKNFSSHDLILIDRETTTDGLNMISGPLSSIYGKNAVYFFNINDLAKLDLKKFSNAYLVAPNKQVPYYLNSAIANRIVPENEYNFTFLKLKVNQNDGVKWPEKEEISVSGKIFKIKNN